MTPFDPVALVAMLSAFYPAVSVSTLAQARSERPAYFSAGSLVGAGDRLQLADGRVFLLIYNGQWSAVGDTSDPAAAGVWDANRIAAFFVSQGVVVADSVIQQWVGYWNLWGWKDPGYFLMRLQHAQELVDAGKATALPADTGGDGLSLDPGPLVPLDASIGLAPKSDPVFEPLVSDGLSQIDDTGPALDNVTATVTAFDPAAASDSLTDSTLDDAAGAHSGAQAALEGQDPGDLVTTSDGHLAIIEATRPDYDAEPPPDAPVVDPGSPPDNGGGSNLPAPA